MADEPQKLGSSAAESAFFDGPAGQELDEELVALARGPSPVAALILILLGLFAGYLVYQYWYDALYALQPPEAEQLGDVLSWRHGEARFRGGELVVPANRYVKLRGVTERRAVVGKHGYAKLAGVPVFAEVNPDVFSQRREDVRTYGQLLAFGGDRYVVKKAGRLVPFSKMRSRYASIVKYLGNDFQMPMCGVELQPELRRALEAKRQRSVLSLQEELGHAPSQAEIFQRLGPECITPWLFQEDVAPRDDRGVLVAWLIAWAVLGGTVGFLGLWSRRYVAFHRR